MGSLCYGPYMLPLFAICALSPGARKFACKRVDCVFLCKCICASEKVLCFRTSVPELFNPAHYRLRSAKLQAAALGGSHCAIAEKHEVLLFFSFYILCSTRQVAPRGRRTATNCKQHHADAFLRHCLVEPQTHSDTLRHSARALFKCFLKCVFVMTGAWTSSQTMAMWRVWCSVALR